MPIPATAGEKAAATRGGCGSGPRPGVSLPVLAVHPEGRPVGPGGVRKSRSGPRRAAVLIAVNALMAAHVIFWLATGMRRTLSPVEPSESMYTLETGAVNAGFIFFALALLATLVFGRFFCGWGCHVVALQDLCAWIMKKAGVRPKPFRSRLLVFAPLLLALYMFVWPTFLREVAAPLAGERWSALAPWLGEVPPRPEIHWELTKQDFWETFPAWYVAIPFLLVCGFAAVYFLGAKGFCTYGCPYGGFFGPLDRAAPGRILVTDACEHCGHCTSVCTSNVRIHEEVRDFGMVVDPGCMKCMDCVSVCPNDALYFGFARPPLLSRKKAPAKRRLSDVPLLAEVALFLVGIALFIGFRNMFGQVPMLMAMGIAGIGAFLTWKLWEMLAAPSVRVQSLQLKLKGRWRPAGAAFAGLALAVLAMGGWGAAVNYNIYAAGVHSARVKATMNEMLSPAYAVPPQQQSAARRALEHFRRASPPRDGGWGWLDTPRAAAERSVLALAAGDARECERWLRRAIESGLASGSDNPAPDQVMALGLVMARAGAPAERVVAEYRALVERAPRSPEARFSLARIQAATGDAAGAAENARATLSLASNNYLITYAALQMLANLGRLDLAVATLEEAARTHPRSAATRACLGLVYAELGRPQDALAQLAEASALEPHNTAYMQLRADLLRSLGRHDEASRLLDPANRSVTPAR